MIDLHIDIETKSDVDLGSVGVYKYAEHPSTEIQLFAWAFNDEDPEVVDLTDNETVPMYVIDCLLDPTVTKWAHNAQFEFVLLEKCLNLKLKIEQWKCTMVLAFYCSLPGALSKVGNIIGLDQDEAKTKEGRKLVLKFCRPQSDRKTKKNVWHNRLTHPTEWERYKEYNKQDVVAERAVHKKLDKYNMPEHEWVNWHLDQKINAYGLPINIRLVEDAINLAETASDEVKQEIMEITGCNPKSTVQMLNWFQEQGCDIANVQKATLANMLNQIHLPETVRYVAEQRLENNKASVSKYDALARSMTADGTVKGVFQFGGAQRTLRWAGRIFQPQNIARGNLQPNEYDAAIDLVYRQERDVIEWAYGGVNSLLTSLVRPCIAAPDGYQLNVADLASIETVMLAWACESEYMLNLFRNGLDPYKDYASYLFKIPYDAVTKKQRTYAKPPVLGGGYMLGRIGMIAYAQGYGVHMTEAQAQEAVNVYRTSYPDVPLFWGRIDRACKKAAHAVQTKRGFKPIEVGPFTVYVQKPFMRIRLPSGRSLSYLNPRIEKLPAPWDSTQLIPNITYMGLKDGKWVRQSTHPGKLTENLIQGISRDVLACGLMNADRANLRPILHVHDEIGTLGRRGDDKELDTLIECMTALPSWCSDAPIRAEGYRSLYYYKD